MLRFLRRSPVGLRAAYERDVRRGLASFAHGGVITESDLAHLPPPVQRYLRVAGVVGQPRVHNFRVRMRGRIRNGPDARWMPFAAEQYNVVDEPAHLFYLTGRMGIVPVQGYHRYVGPAARMIVKAAGVVPVVDVSGPEIVESETVTMFNDMCVMAPATLISSAIAWEAVDARTARAAFSNAGRTIRAELTFNDAGELIDFRSDDRYQASSDGRTMKKVRWSTPLYAYRSFGRTRLAAGGEARWHEAEGHYAYVEITLESVEYNLSPETSPRPVRAHVDAPTEVGLPGTARRLPRDGRRPGQKDGNSVTISPSL